jgi:hypothetical protein
VPLFMVLISISSTVHGQKNKQKALKYYLVHIDFLLKDGGKWRTDNKDYNPVKDFSVNYYLIEYTKGANEHTLNFKIKGYILQKTQWITFQEGFYKWDDNKKKVLYHGSYTDQEEVNGEPQIITAKKISFKYLFSSPIISKPGYQTIILEFTHNQIEETQYDYANQSCLGRALEKSVWDRAL